MMRPKIKSLVPLVTIVIFLFLCLAAITSHLLNKTEVSREGKVVLSATAARLYEPIEVDLYLSGAYLEPGNIDKLEIAADFFLPSGRKISVPGFLYQDYARRSVNGGEVLEKKGSSFWKVRFTPLETGDYSARIRFKYDNRVFDRGSVNFNVKESDLPGFIKVDKESIFYLKFDNGQPYFAVGESVAWTGRHKKTYGYDYFFSKLSENGCNYSRVWLVEWNLALEWKDYEKTAGKVYGLGKYSLDNSWRLDYIIQLAEKKGIYLLLTLDTYGSIMESDGFWGEERWDANPYNMANGGPCKTPEDFWINPEAKRLYKNRLKYILARWGYSPHVMALELWNEVNAPVEWVREMADFIKKNDPYGHLVTTSIGYPFEEKHNYDPRGIWDLDAIDFTQTHLYGDGGSIKDMAKEVSKVCILMTEQYKKPHLVAEFGIEFSADDIKYDSKGMGIQVHNALWASAMSRSFGTAMTHWKEYIDKKDLYYQFKSISNFVRDINWLGEKWNVAGIRNIRSAVSGEKNFDLILPCDGDWGEGGGEKISISRNGVVEGKINQFIHGMSKEGDLRFAPVFYVDYSRGGKLVLDVKSVAQGAELNVYLDNGRIWHHVFAAGPGEGEWKRSVLDEKYGVYIVDYDKKYEIPVPAGEHVIKIENTGIDWVSLNSITLTDYLDEYVPPVKIIGLSRGAEAVLWVHNTENTWFNCYNNMPVPPVKEVMFDVVGIFDGIYEVEVWDTASGTVSYVDTTVCKNGSMTLKLSELHTDVAVKLRKRG
jgi:hypothetical protein